MSRRVRVGALAVAAVIVVLGVVLALNVENAPTDEGGWVGRPAPSFAVETLDGERITAADLRGRVVLINFWNTWCIPCIEEAPALKKLHAAYGDDPGFVMLGIVRDEPGGESLVRRYVADEGVGWTIAMDDDLKASLAWGVTGQPETYVIAPDGTVASELRGAATFEHLEQMLAAAEGVA